LLLILFGSADLFLEKIMETSKCIHLTEFINAELEVMQKHLSDHKWFNHIEKEDEALVDFNNKFGWLMREFYCRFACSEKDNCIISKDLKTPIRKI
jgi:hypothetical protein